jgi:hypothetical protein
MLTAKAPRPAHCRAPGERPAVAADFQIPHAGLLEHPAQGSTVWQWLCPQLPISGLSRVHAKTSTFRVQYEGSRDLVLRIRWGTDHLDCERTIANILQCLTTPKEF